MDSNVVWHDSTVETAARAQSKNQRAGVVWFTGLSGSGKSTLANALDFELHGMGNHTFLLDGDNVRHGLNKDLGFSDKDRVENIRRVGEVARLMVDAGLIVMTAFISPFRADRKMVRSLFEPGQFIEVYVSAPLDVCESRDPKGLYKKARGGVIKDFTGISSPYEEPLSAELTIDSAQNDISSSTQQMMAALRQFGFVA